MLVRILEESAMREKRVKDLRKSCSSYAWSAEAQISSSALRDISPAGDDDSRWKDKESEVYKFRKIVGKMKKKEIERDAVSGRMRTNRETDTRYCVYYEGG